MPLLLSARWYWLNLHFHFWEGRDFPTPCWWSPSLTGGISQFHLAFYCLVYSPHPFCASFCAPCYPLPISSLLCHSILSCISISFVSLHTTFHGQVPANCYLLPSLNSAQFHQGLLAFVTFSSTLSNFSSSSLFLTFLLLHNFFSIKLQ